MKNPSKFEAILESNLNGQHQQTNRFIKNYGVKDFIEDLIKNDYSLNRLEKEDLILKAIGR
mgnify:CR=1 FL=1